jgi:integrase
LWLRRYIHALQDIPEDLPSEKKLERFLTELAIKEDVAATTQNQAFNAVVFFYAHVLEQPLGNVDALRAKRPVRERHAPSVGDTQALLRTIRDAGGYPNNLIARMLYGCSLRVSEPLNLRIKDINLERWWSLFHHRSPACAGNFITPRLPWERRRLAGEFQPRGGSCSFDCLQKPSSPNGHRLADVRYGLGQVSTL